MESEPIAPPVEAQPRLPSDTLRDAVRFLVDRGGVQKGIFGESHYQSQNLAASLGLLDGFAGHATVVHYQEVSDHIAKTGVEALLAERNAMAVPELRRMAGQMLTTVKFGDDQPVPADEELPRQQSLERYEQLLALPSVEPKLMMWTYPRRDLDQFVNDPKLSVATVGMNHAIAEYAGENLYRLPATEGLGRLAPNLRIPPQTKRTQKSTLDAFMRAQRTAKTILVSQNQLWDEVHGKPKYRPALAYYIDRGHAAMVVPLGKGNATIIAPESTLAAMHAFAQRFPDGVEIYCKHDPACDPL